MNSFNGKTTPTSGYAPLNGLRMYYEIEGTGEPLVYLPPAFGFAGLKSFPALVQRHSVVTVDFQGHGRTADIARRVDSFFVAGPASECKCVRNLGIGELRFVLEPSDLRRDWDWLSTPGAEHSMIVPYEFCDHFEPRRSWGDAHDTTPAESESTGRASPEGRIV